MDAPATTQTNDGTLPAIAPAAPVVAIASDAPTPAMRAGERALPIVATRSRPNPRAKRRAKRGRFLVVVLLPAKHSDRTGAVELLDDGEESVTGEVFDMNQLGARIVLDLKQARELGRQNRATRRALKQFRAQHPNARAVVLEVCASDNDLCTRFVAGLGDLHAIEYEVPRSSARAGLPFRHRFRRGMQVLALTKRGEQTIVRRKGSRLRVTSRGIED